jgi:exopolyphosphatase/guanosine-5'-triphosphate,3'-diphosphate pyrophosphatase
MAKLGIIDIGTNSIHMVLAEVESDFSYKILDRFKDMTRLGDGTFRTRRLSEAAMVRGLEVVRTLVTLARNKGYERIKAVATSAVREARNGGEFLDAISRQTGLPVRVVSGEEEARLIYLGVRHSMDLADQPSVIVDVGGGSVELIVGDRKKLIQGQSLKLGAIRLKDLYFKQDPPAKAMLRETEKAVESRLKAALQPFKGWQFDRLIGTSGMVGNLAEVIHLRRTGHPLHQLNLATISLKDVRTVEELLARSSFKERLALPGLDPKRADTLLPASMVIRTLMERTGQDRMTISDKAIRDGLIYDFIERNREGLKVERDIPNVRRRHVIYLARRCHYPKAHSHHVAKLAARLFDQTRTLHGLGDREREWLEYAALLHDIGYLINARQHHKHAYYLIKNADLYGLTADEVELIANVARYHRRALPHDRHATLHAVGVKRRKTVEILSALLRIADALDRTQFGVIQNLHVRLGKPVTIELDATGDAELELWAARNRADLFEKVFKRSVQFVVHAREGAPA